MKSLLAHKPTNVFALLSAIAALLASDQFLAIAPSEWTPYIMMFVALFGLGSGWNVPTDDEPNDRPTSAEDMLRRAGKTMTVLGVLFVLSGVSGCASSKIVSADLVQARIEADSMVAGEALINQNGQTVSDLEGEGNFDAVATYTFCVNRKLSFRMCTEASFGFRLEVEEDGSGSVGVCIEGLDELACEVFTFGEFISEQDAE